MKNTVKSFESSKNQCGSFVEITTAWGNPAIRTMCPMFDKEKTNLIVLTPQMAREIIAELTRLFPERRTRRGHERVALSERMRAAVQQLVDSAAHDSGCIRSRFDGGWPTKGGGYEMRFAGKVYRAAPVDETPKCDCGLDATMAALAPLADEIAALEGRLERLEP